MAGDLEPTTRNELRASHEDRDAIVERLRVAAGDGRIDAEELDQRIEAAMSAKTYGELAVIIKDLPATAGAPLTGAQIEPVEASSITVAHGKREKVGAWVVPARISITARHSKVVLDFTQALFPGGRHVEIDLDARHSSILLIVPGGSAVSSDNLDTRHCEVKQREFGIAGPESVRLRLSGQIAHSSTKIRGLSRMQLRRRARRAALTR